MTLSAASGHRDITVGGVALGARRRLVIDLSLLAVVFALLAGFFDMRSAMRQQTEAFRAVSARLDAIETRERGMPTTTATKGDIDRLERRLDRLQEILMAPRSPR